MNPRLSRRALLLALASAASGCSLSRRSPVADRTFLLRPPDPAAPGEPAPSGVLMIRPFRAAPAFESRAFIIRESEAEFVADPYNAFLLSPGPMLTSVFADWIRGLGAFSSVITGGSQIPPTHAIEGEILELYGDYRDRNRPEARLALQVRMLHPVTGGRAPILWQRNESRTVSIPRLGAEELVAGWNQALAEICQSLAPLLTQRPASPASDRQA